MSTVFTMPYQVTFKPQELSYVNYWYDYFKTLFLLENRASRSGVLRGVIKYSSLRMDELVKKVGVQPAFHRLVVGPKWPSSVIAQPEEKGLAVNIALPAATILDLQKWNSVFFAKDRLRSGIERRMIMLFVIFGVRELHNETRAEVDEFFRELSEEEHWLGLRRGRPTRRTGPPA